MNTLDIVKDRQQQISVVALNGIMVLWVNGTMGYKVLKLVVYDSPLFYAGGTVR